MQGGETYPRSVVGAGVINIRSSKHNQSDELRLLYMPPSLTLVLQRGGGRNKNTLARGKIALHTLTLNCIRGV